MVPLGCTNNLTWHWLTWRVAQLYTSSMTKKLSWKQWQIFQKNHMPFFLRWLRSSRPIFNHYWRRVSILMEIDLSKKTPNASSLVSHHWFHLIHRPLFRSIHISLPQRSMMNYCSSCSPCYWYFAFDQFWERLTFSKLSLFSHDYPHPMPLFLHPHRLPLYRNAPHFIQFTP